ncbi:hypothetical protein MKW98_010349 [Papaver atlanticum]|uniref:Uncharacterized protein n=1 Tax=Papaver atlanticum TaxID=357466 RepID=A0AAD4XHP4_9MAGN|nr:hypothetical protein MKW98_010349 [Papaver atlanticum]
MYKHNQHSLENRLLVIKKETRNFVSLIGRVYFYLVLLNLTQLVLVVDSPISIGYMQIYPKVIPDEEAYKLVKYVKGYDYTKYTDEDEEYVLIVPIPTVELDRENEEGEEEQELG